MTIHQFTAKEFEAALPVHKETGEPLWLPMGEVNKELQYQVFVRKGVKIIVRSSIRPNGVAAETGKDSIRAWLAREDNSPLGNKVNSHTSRVKGWEERMAKILRELWRRSSIAGDCPTCGKPMSIFKVRKEGKNKGKLFAKCSEHNHFFWLEDADSQREMIVKHKSREASKWTLPSDEEFTAGWMEEPTIKAKVDALKKILTENREHAVYALCFIADHQTAYEYEAQMTSDLNNVGFSGIDAEILTSFTQQFRNRGTLSPKQMALVHKKMPRYARQIFDILTDRR